jgi:exonuclease-1
MLDMLAHHEVVPVVVLDGGPLPSKCGQETERRTRRDENRRLGLAALRAGNRTLALSHFQKAVDVTPAMALAFIALLRQRGVEYVVAPFEADAQLAHLAATGAVDAVVTEDSDMVPYGVPCVVFKLDRTGNGRMLRLADVLARSDMRGFTQGMVCQACILAGCDYLPSVSGMGIRTAIKLVKRHKDALRAIRAIRLDGAFEVPKDYEEQFRNAELTFRHQQVYDREQRRAVPLTPVPDGVSWESLAPFLGDRLDDELAIGIAEGRVDPITRVPFPPQQ